MLGIALRYAIGSAGQFLAGQFGILPWMQDLIVLLRTSPVASVAFSLTFSVLANGVYGAITGWGLKNLLALQDEDDDYS